MLGLISTQLRFETKVFCGFTGDEQLMQCLLNRCHNTLVTHNFSSAQGEALMLLTEYEKYESANAFKKLILYLLITTSIVFIQQSYARTHQYSIEQPVGLGWFEYFFRHPEIFVGLHFEYPVSRFEGDHLGE